MKSVSISRAKNTFSALIERVKRGQSVVITDRNKSVAKIVPMDPSDGPDEQRMVALEREGLVVPPRKRISDSFFKRPRPKSPAHASVLQALLDERSDDR